MEEPAASNDHSVCIATSQGTHENNEGPQTIGSKHRPTCSEPGDHSTDSSIGSKKPTINSWDPSVCPSSTEEPHVDHKDSLIGGLTDQNTNLHNHSVTPAPQTMTPIYSAFPSSDHTVSPSNHSVSLPVCDHQVCPLSSESVLANNNTVPLINHTGPIDHLNMTSSNGIHPFSTQTLGSCDQNKSLTNHTKTPSPISLQTPHPHNQAQIDQSDTPTDQPHTPGESTSIQTDFAGHQVDPATEASIQDLLPSNKTNPPTPQTGPAFDPEASYRECGSWGPPETKEAQSGPDTVLERQGFSKKRSSTGYGRLRVGRRSVWGRRLTARQQRLTEERCFRWGYLPHAEPGVTQSDSAISRRGIAGRERLFYGAQIGSETRNLEFKLGRGHYLRNIFQHDLRKYACAFLNGEGGSLLVGVDNAGKVRGVCCNHRLQDRTRLMVDAMLKRFQPPLLPHNYNLSFLPVVQPGTSQPFLQVLRFSVWPPPVPDPPMLYQTDQGMVYLRRDASVEGPLTAGLIQQWFRQRWSAAVEGLRQQFMEELQLWEPRDQSRAGPSLQRGQRDRRSRATLPFSTCRNGFNREDSPSGNLVPTASHTTTVHRGSVQNHSALGSVNVTQSEQPDHHLQTAVNQGISRSRESTANQRSNTGSSSGDRLQRNLCGGCCHLL